MRSLRRFLLVAALACLPLVSRAQTDRTVLIEEFTGTWCQFCPDGADSLHAILQRMPNVRALSYHDKDDMSTSAGNTVIDSLAVTSFPGAAVDRVVWQVTQGQYAFSLNRSVWGLAASSRAPTPSPIALSIKGTCDVKSRKLTINAYGDVLVTTPGIYYIHVVLSEDSLNYTQKRLINGTVFDISPYYHFHVVRRMLTGALGEMLTTSGLVSGQTFQKYYQTTIPSSWDITKMAVTVFVDTKYSQPYQHRDVLQTVQEPVWSNTGVFTTVEVASATVPAATRLHQNYPNPFNPSTDIVVELGSAAQGTLTIFDAMGRAIRTLADCEMTAGVHTFRWDGLDSRDAAVPSGIYFYRFRSGAFNETRQMTMTR